MKYVAFLCDDDKNQLLQLKHFLRLAAIILADKQPIDFNIIEKADFETARKYLAKNKIKGGIYFLDVELGKDINHNNGFDLAEIIKEDDERAQIIFLTSHPDLSIITFRRRLGPVDYIIKTNDIDKLKRRVISTVEIALKNLHEFDLRKRMTFSYKIGHHIENISINEVIYLETTSVPHRLHLMRTNGEAEFLGTLKNYFSDYSELIKINESCLVNPKNILNINLKDRQVTFVNHQSKYFARSERHEMRQLFQMQRFE